MKHIFYREVVRDYSLIIEEAWFFGLTKSCDKAFGKNPYSPINVFNLREGAIELWHEVNAYKWLLDKLGRAAKEDPSLIKKIISDYNESLKYHKKFWKKGYCNTRKELVDYIEHVFDSMLGFIVFYYLGVDERTPKEMREFVLSMRKEDKFFEEADRLIRKSVKKIYPKTKGLETGVVFVEIKKNKIPSVEELKKRRNNCVLIPGIFFENISLQDFVKKHPDYEFSLEVLSNSNADELKGRSAFLGKVTGVAKIVKRNDQLDKVKAGDILIAPMTLPEFLPAMKLAGAFVTDEGGITAHAAIIARELKKPCIIGTKFATHVFRDGDLIEVDADKGIIRKISGNGGAAVEPIYTKYFMRVLPLAMVEVWYFGEKADPRQYTEKISVSHPYIIFECNDGIVTTYFDKRGVDWIKNHIRRARSADKDYCKEVASRFKEEISKIKKVLEENKAISIKEYEKFAFHVRHTWPWFELVWWFIDLLDENNEKDGEEMKVLQDARKFGELFYTNSVQITKKTLEKKYPNIRKLVSELTLQEAITGKLPTNSVLEERRKSYYYTDSTLFTGATKKQIEEMFKVKLENEEIQMREIKGTAAYPGKVVGKVRKIFSNEQIKYFIEGEVLVASSTLPDFLPAMKKAVAIISDEGGMICHAAIIARELKKPCIVGTKNATKIFKDGDLVEVDAYKGIVRRVTKPKI